MFFTTVLMVVLLVVALSTATLAWFTSNDTVTITQTTITAATSNDASIGIGWTTTEAESGTTITFMTPTNTGNPMIPKILPLVTSSNPGAYYVTTSVKVAAGEFADGNFSGFAAKGIAFHAINGAQVVEITETGNAITADNSLSYETLAVAPYNLPGLETTAKYAKVYMTKAQIAAGFYVFASPVAPQGYTITPFGTAPTTYDSLLVVEGTATAGQISTTAFSIEGSVVTCTYEGTHTVLNLTELPVAGQYLFSIQNTPAVYGYVHHKASMSAGAFVSGALPGGRDYMFAVHTPGSLDTTALDGSHSVQDVYLAAAQATYYANAADDEFIYCVKNSGAQPKTPLMNAGATLGFVDNFTTGVIDGSNRFTSAIMGADPFLLQDWDTPTSSTRNYTSFFVRNNSAPTTGTTSRIQMTANLFNDPDLRLAVFVRDGATLSYVGTLAATSANTRYGTILEGENRACVKSYQATQASTGFNLHNLAPQGAIEISIVAWFDGEQLTPLDSNKQVPFTVTFKANAAE
jgi:hypothetical protein